MPGTAQAVSAPPANPGQLLGALDQITVRAALAAELHTDPDVLRARLREVAALASQAAAAYQ